MPRGPVWGGRRERTYSCVAGLARCAGPSWCRRWRPCGSRDRSDEWPVPSPDVGTGADRTRNVQSLGISFVRYPYCKQGCLLYHGL